MKQLLLLFLFLVAVVSHYCYHWHHYADHYCYCYCYFHLYHSCSVNILLRCVIRSRTVHYMFLYREGIQFYFTIAITMA